MMMMQATSSRGAVASYTSDDTSTTRHLVNRTGRDVQQMVAGDDSFGSLLEQHGFLVGQLTRRQ